MASVQRGDVVAGKYTVERSLGAGGMGEVVLATHPILGACAIKLLHAEHAKNAEAITRFVREAQAAQRIRSEHVVRVSDVGFDDARAAPYIVMELLDGEDLAHLLRSHGPLSVDCAVEYVLQASEALAEAHAYGIIHRDLKPANMFLTHHLDGTPLVKLVDFGISKIASPGDGTPTLTRTTGLMGTVLYMSPEQLQRPREIDARSDIWALGVVLYELLSGRLPFVGDDIPNTCVRVLTEEPTPLSALCPELPVPLLAIVERCLRKAREERFAHLGDFATAFKPIATPAARASIDRIVRVLERAGQRASAFPDAPVPALPIRSSTSLAGPTGGTSIPGSVSLPTPTSEVPPTRKRWVYVSAAAALLGIASAWTLRASIRGGPPPYGASQREPEASASRGTAAVASPSTAEVASSVTSSASPDARGAERDAPTATTPPAISASRVRFPSLSASTSPRIPAASATVSAPSAKASASASATVEPLKATPSATSCDPPYFLDAEGLQHIKPGCR